MTIPTFRLTQAMDHPLLERITLAAEAAGAELRAFFRSHNRVTAKGIANFVSEADVASETVLRRMLLEAEPQANFLGEEGGGDAIRHPPADAMWVVDPLDGTTNFLHGLPHFAISIAYRRAGVTEVGVIHNPVSSDWYIAIRGQGAFFNAERIRVSAVNDLSGGLYCFGFFYDRDRAMTATLKCVESLMRQQVHGIRRFGAAALDLAAVACGRFEGFFEFELQPWDFAAGALLLEEAGGALTDCRGNEVQEISRSSVLATNGMLHRDLLELVRPFYDQCVDIDDAG